MLLPKYNQHCIFLVEFVDTNTKIFIHTIFILWCDCILMNASYVKKIGYENSCIVVCSVVFFLKIQLFVGILYICKRKIQLRIDFSLMEIRFFSKLRAYHDDACADK